MAYKPLVGLIVKPLDKTEFLRVLAHTAGRETHVRTRGIVSHDLQLHTLHLPIHHHFDGTDDHLSRRDLPKGMEQKAGMLHAAEGPSFGIEERFPLGLF